MPNREVHQIAGAAAGSMLAGLWSKRKSGIEHPSIVVGGLLGGILGASIPDYLDPPDSPNHRGVGHSLALASAIGVGCTRALPFLITNALRAKEIADSYSEQGFAVPLLIGLRLQAALKGIGLALGIPAGVASHLLMDGDTPDGIRLFNSKV